MAVVTLKTFSMPFAGQVMVGLRALLRGTKGDAGLEPEMADAEAAAQIADYEKNLQRELGHADDADVKAHDWTRLEREDTEMLARVREALYADD